MGAKTDKKPVQVYLVADLHRRLKVLAAERGVTISYLVELATRRQYEFDGLLAAEAPQPYGREETGRVPPRRRGK